MPSSASLMTVVIRLRQSSWLGSAQTTRFGEGSSTGSEKGNAAIDRPNLLSSLRGSSLFMLRRLPNEWRRSTNLFGKSSFGCYFYYSFLQSLIRSDHEHFNAFRLDPAVSMTYRKKLHSATSISLLRKSPADYESQGDTEANYTPQTITINFPIDSEFPLAVEAARILTREAFQGGESG